MIYRTLTSIHYQGQRIPIGRAVVLDMSPDKLALLLDIGAIAMVATAPLGMTLPELNKKAGDMSVPDFVEGNTPDLSVRFSLSPEKIDAIKGQLLEMLSTPEKA